MSDRRKHLLIFEPGLSTANEVSSVSGRGVGMDVVRAVEACAGRTRIITLDDESYLNDRQPWPDRDSELCRAGRGENSSEHNLQR